MRCLSKIRIVRLQPLSVRKLKIFFYSHPSVLSSNSFQTLSLHRTDCPMEDKRSKGEKQCLIMLMFHVLNPSAPQVDLHSWKHLLHSCQCQHPISISRTSWVKTNRAECQRLISDQCYACVTGWLTWLLVLSALRWPLEQQACICQTLNLLRKRHNQWDCTCSDTADYVLSQFTFFFVFF